MKKMKNEMVLNFDELNKLDQFEQANIVWSIIEKLGFKDATMEPNDSGYSIELECEESDETEPIDNIEEVLLNHFDEVMASATSTKDLYRTLWNIYEDEFNADEDRDGQIFEDMVFDAIKYPYL